MLTLSVQAFSTSSQCVSYDFFFIIYGMKHMRSNLVGFTLTVVNEFRQYLRQFSTNFHEILHTLFSIHVVTTLKVSRSFDKYVRS